MRSVGWVVLALVLGACGGSGSVEVIDAWGPPTPPSVDVGALYVTVANGTGTDDRIDTITGERCGRIELHATQIDDDNIMQMRPAGPDQLTVLAGERLEMAPGGLHIMCLDMPTPFVDGEAVTLVLTLASGTKLGATALIENR